MHLLRVWIALGLVAACAAHAAVIYKWTDADGVVHYSDQSVPGSEKIVTSSSSSNGIAVGTARSPSIATSGKKSPSHLEYSAFALDSPANQHSFFAYQLI